jgi:hypothetical protein
MLRPVQWSDAEKRGECLRFVAWYGESNVSAWADIRVGLCNVHRKNMEQ